MAGQRLNLGGSSAFIDHADAIGSTVMETDPSGAVDWDVVNGPWGQVWQQTGTRQSQVFAGMDWQINDPLMPSATREYSDGLGRWMTPDPENAGAALGDPQSWNMYAYVGNNPTSRDDPSGEDQRICQTDDSGNKANCTTLTDKQYDAYLQENKDTLSFAGDKIVANGSQIGTTEYVPTIDPSTAFAFHAVGEFSNAEIKSAAIKMGINGALVGIGGLIDMGAEALLTEEGSAATEVKFGNNANQAYHTFRHLEEAGIDKQAVESAIRNDLAGKGASLPQGLTTGQVNVQGRILQYNAYKFPDGAINVGRITVH